MSSAPMLIISCRVSAYLTGPVASCDLATKKAYTFCGQAKLPVGLVS